VRYTQVDGVTKPLKRNEDEKLQRRILMLRKVVSVEKERMYLWEQVVMVSLPGRWVAFDELGLMVECFRSSD
jgi:hypothetical protein